MNIVLAALNGVSAAFFVWVLYEEFRNERNLGTLATFTGFVALFVANTVAIA